MVKFDTAEEKTSLQKLHWPRRLLLLLLFGIVLSSFCPNCRTCRTFWKCIECVPCLLHFTSLGWPWKAVSGCICSDCGSLQGNFRLRILGALPHKKKRKRICWKNRKLSSEAVSRKILYKLATVRSVQRGPLYSGSLYSSRQVQKGWVLKSDSLTKKLWEPWRKRLRRNLKWARMGLHRVVSAAAQQDEKRC